MQSKKKTKKAAAVAFEVSRLPHTGQFHQKSAQNNSKFILHSKFLPIQNQFCSVMLVEIVEIANHMTMNCDLIYF
jgi:hypothetical protein